MCTGYMQIVEAVKAGRVERCSEWTQRRTYIGQRSVRSKEAPRHVAGRGRFVDDLVLPRMLHACILRSPYAPRADRVRQRRDGAAGCRASSASSRRTTSSACRGRSSRDATPPACACRSRSTRPPSTRCATSASRWRWSRPTRAPRAEDALELIEIDYEPLPAVTTTDDAADAVRAAASTTSSAATSPGRGTCRTATSIAAFERADRVVRENLKIHRYSSTPLEPFACLAESHARAADDLVQLRSLRKSSTRR